MQLQSLLKQIEPLSPLHLAEPWDQVGLHLGDPRRPVRKVLLCIDLTQAVLDEAVARKVGLIIAYHPPIFEPLPRLTATDPKQRLILQAAERRIAIFSPHTALDAVEGGVNDFLAQGVGKGRVRPIRPSTSPTTPTSSALPPSPTTYKLVTFVPPTALNRVRSALSKAGAGRIGDYTQCGFGVWGHGTFRGGPSTNPAVGRRGRLEHVDEIRLEMICPAEQLPSVLDAHRKAHPYEEPAYDIYRLENPQPPDAPAAAHASTAKAGQGRIVELEAPVKFNALVKRLARHLGVDHLQTAPPAEAHAVKRIALCAGAGGSLLDHVDRPDVFLTGEMRHHSALAATERGIGLILAGHAQTERPYLKLYRKKLAAAAPTVQFVLSKTDHPPTRLTLTPDRPR